MMKKFILLISVLALVLGLSMTAYANSIEFVIDNNVMYSDDAENGFVAHTLETAPYETQGRTMVPVRIVTESFGADVSWDETTKTVGIKAEGIEVTLTIDSEKAYVNGEEYILDVPATEINGRTMVPVRFVSEKLNYNVGYNDPFRAVYITNEQPVMTVGDITYNRDDLRAYNSLFLSNETAETVYNSFVVNLEQFAIFAQECAKENLAFDNKSYNEFIESVKPDADKIRTETMLMPYATLLETYGKAHAYGRTLDIKVTTEDMERVFDENYFCAKHILFSYTDLEEGVEKPASEVAKLEDLAKKVLKEAKSGADFDRLVDEYSEDPSKVMYPNGIPFTTGMMVKEFEEAVKALKIGEISDIVETEYGYHIIQRVELPALNDNLEEFMSNIVYAEKITEITDSLKVNYEINVDFTFDDLKAMFAK